MRPDPVDETHARDLRSFVDSANEATTDFPIQNLPYGVFERPNGGPSVGVAIGDGILDLRECLRLDLLKGMPTGILEAVDAKSLNPLMARPAIERRALRHRVSHLLRDGGAQVTARPHRERALVRQKDARLLLPATIGDYTDFYASVHHATNVGTMLRPDNPLFPNYKWVPIGYHGRASSIVASGAPIVRPWGQTEPKGGDATPGFCPSRSLDYEMEVGVFVAEGNALGSAIPMDAAESKIFGLCLLNDWSARDVQKWEYQPLGPFLAKNFATTISPWVVTAEALAPFRTPPAPRAEGDPKPLAYLSGPANDAAGGFDVRLEVFLSTQKMRDASIGEMRLSSSNLSFLYWTPAQMIAHHSSNGCNLAPGDLFGTGTVSGPSKESRGCLLELTWRGSEKLALPSGETRAFLEDGDEITFRGRAERAGFATIGFGECRGRIEPARPS